MNRKELSQNHWKYYLMLEKRFVESIEFVELHEDNFDAFSNGYALLIQAIGAELDTVFKEFYGFNTTDRKTVADYAQYILTNTPDIKNQNNPSAIRRPGRGVGCCDGQTEVCSVPGCSGRNRR